MVALVVGAAASLGLTLRAGNRGQSSILMLLFVLWVLSPFVGLALADKASPRWTISTRATLYVVTLISTAGSLALYGGVVSMPPGTKTAAAFLLAPLASWLLLVIVVAVATYVSTKGLPRDADA